jgi:methionyl-tRNA formyltransferase
MKNITVFAMTQKGFEVIKSMHNAFPNVIKNVISARDANISNDYYVEIMNFCNENAIEFHDRSDNFEVTTEYALAISWRWIIKINSSRLIVFHDSLLPKYRGFNPLVTSLINADKFIGVTGLYATDDYDKGGILFQAKSQICYPIKIQDAITIIIDNYIEVALKVANCVANNIQMVALPQCEEDASYSLWRDEEDYFIDWSKSSEYIKRFIDSVGSPYKGACSLIDGVAVSELAP